MENNNNGTDRISYLPEDLQAHILSFLSPRQAVQTCILSKRWRSTWASMLILRFDYTPTNPRERTLDNWIKFMKFVVQILQNRDRSISLDTFEWHWDPLFSIYGTSTDLVLIQHVLSILKHKLRVFSVRASRSVLSGCIGSIFTCASLQNISLQNASSHQSHVFHRLSALKLPHLKQLVLNYLIIDDNFLKVIFQGCPILEEVKLFNCRLDVSLIFSEALNSLVLYCCDLEKELVICTPNLQYLDIYNTQSDGGSISFKNVASLVDARVQRLNVHLCDDVKNLNGGLNLHNLSSKFSMVVDTLVTAQSKIAGEEVPNYQNFKKLKRLQLGCWDLSNSFSSIDVLLHKSPNLKKLSLQIFPSKWKAKSSKEEWRDAKSSYEELRDALLLQEHLEVVEIIHWFKEREQIVNKLLKELSSLVKSTGQILIKVRT